jgi:transglutaminase-like putative cysteine protease
MHPLSDAHQTCTGFALKIAPEARFRRRLDFFSNWVHAFEIGVPHAELLVETRSEVTTHPVSVDPADAPTHTRGGSIPPPRKSFTNTSTRVHPSPSIPIPGDWPSMRRRARIKGSYRGNADAKLIVEVAVRKVTAPG